MRRFGAEQGGTAVAVSLLGFGGVGQEIYRQIVSSERELLAMCRCPVFVHRILVKDDVEASSARTAVADPASVTTDFEETLKASILVEAIGGVEPAYSYVMTGIERGCSIVTVNKDLMGVYGPAILRAALERKVVVDYEATVGGAVPVLGPIREHLAPAGIYQVTGVFSGTCNNLLTQMKDRLLSLREGLDASKKAGATEPDPRRDTSGRDSAAKIALTLTEAFGFWFEPSEVATEGVEGVSLVDMAFALEARHCIKLIGLARRLHGSQFWAAVFPAMVPADSLLGRVEGHDGAVVVSGEGFGRVVLQGTAAGPRAVAAKVIAGIARIARRAGCEPDYRVPSGTAALTRTEPTMPHYARLRGDALPSPRLADLVLSEFAGRRLTPTWHRSETSDGGVDLAVFLPPCTRDELHGVLQALKSVHGISTCAIYRVIDDSV
ncbi:MAG: homoserine dehydrogenase [Firmicutes bacterium]|nr:homoserine dehydrogenase [Bacillota bacterium]